MNFLACMYSMYQPIFLTGWQCHGQCDDSQGQAWSRSLAVGHMECFLYRESGGHFVALSFLVINWGSVIISLPFVRSMQLCIVLFKYIECTYSIECVYWYNVFTPCVVRSYWMKLQLLEIPSQCLGCIDGKIPLNCIRNMFSVSCMPAAGEDFLQIKASLISTCTSNSSI